MVEKPTDPLGASAPFGASASHVEAPEPRRGVVRATLAAWRGVLASCVGAALLIGCTQHAVQQSALGTDVPLGAASNLAGAATPGVRVWRAPDIGQYPASNYYIPPATVDQGPASRFAGVDPTQVANLVTEDVRRAVGRRFPVVSTPGPGTHTIQLVLVRVVPPQSTYISNGPYPWPQGFIGMPNAGVTAGEMVVAGKFTVSSTGKLLAAFIAPVTAPDMMMAASASPEGTTTFLRDAAASFANDLAASIARQREINAQAQQ